MPNAEHIELTSLFIGLLLSTGVFAVKAAVGGWHCLALHGRHRRPWIVILLLFPYLLLFEASHWLLRIVGLSRLSVFSLRYFGMGVILHLIMCAGLVVWGYRLLVRDDAHSHGDRSWLLLVIPCPVCASAVLLACTMAQLLYPHYTGMMRVLLPVVFIALYFGTFATLRLIRCISGTTSLRLAAWMMLLLAAYFTLLLIMSPQWAQLDRIHALAQHSIPPAVSDKGFWLAIVLLPSTFAIGFAHSLLKRRN